MTRTFMNNKAEGSVKSLFQWEAKHIAFPTGTMEALRV